MSRLASRTVPSPSMVVLAVAALAAVLIGTALIAVGPRRASRVSSDGERGTAIVSLSLPPFQVPTLVDYAVRSSGDALLAEGSLGIVAPGAQLTRNLVLPSGKGHTVTFSAHPTGAQPVGTGAPPLAISTFDLVAGQTTQVRTRVATYPGRPVTGATSLREAAAAIERAGPTETGAVSTGIDDILPSCQRCQLANSTGSCDPPFLTAISNTNAATGEQTGIGWGCATLPTDAAQNTCVALLHCLNTHDCAHGANPVIGCYCGTAAPAACIGGSGIDGVCIDEYQAAATASPGGPSDTAAAAQLSRFIATVASDPSTGVGLADNIKQCAISARCGACEQL